MGLTTEATKARDGRASLGHAGEEAPWGRGRKETMERDLSPRRGPHACQGGVREPRAAPRCDFSGLKCDPLFILSPKSSLLRYSTLWPDNALFWSS